MKVVIKLVLSLVMVVCLQSCSEDTLNENGQGTLTGTIVKKGDNTPLADVKISTSPVSTTVFTDENGFFIINSINAGEYSVQAEKDDYISSFEAANISDSQVSNVVFELNVSTANNRPPTEPIIIAPLDNIEGVSLDVNLIWSSSLFGVQISSASKNAIYLEFDNLIPKLREKETPMFFFK